MAAEHVDALEVRDEEDDWFDTTSNTLLVPTVLDILCNVCELSDLKRFRLVCKQWHEQSLRRWRKCMVLCISEDGHRERLDTDTYLDIRNTKALTDNLPDIKNKPYLNYSVRLMNQLQSDCEDPSEDSRPTREDYEAFWDAMGPMMQSLRFEMEEVQFDWKLSPWLIEKTPNLESLALVVYGTEDFFAAVEGKVHTKLTHMKVTPNTDCWTPILKTYPNIKNITLAPDCEQDIRVIFEAMRVVGDPNRTMNLKCERELQGVTETFALLADLQQAPNLQFLDFGIEFVSDHLQATGLMLALHYKMSQTVKALRVSEMADEDFIPLHRLLQASWPMLEHLTVECAIVRDLNFVQDAPNLSVLQLRSVQLDQLNSTVLDDSNRGSLGKLQTLVVDIDDVGNLDLGNLRESDILLIVHLAPNLTNLTAPLDNGSFRALCTSLKEIRHLNVMGDVFFSTALDDEGITGIINGAMESFPNIKNLKYLYSFKTSRTNLTDLSINEGFLKMDHLRRMEIAFARTTSDAAFGAIRDRFRTRNVTRSRYLQP